MESRSQSNQCGGGFVVVDDYTGALLAQAGATLWPGRGSHDASEGLGCGSGPEEEGKIERGRAVAVVVWLYRRGFRAR